MDDTSTSSDTPGRPRPDPRQGETRDVEHVYLDEPATTTPRLEPPATTRGLQCWLPTLDEVRARRAQLDLGGWEP